MESLVRFYRKITPLWLSIIAFLVSLLATWVMMEGDFGIVIPDNIKATSLYIWFMSDYKIRIVVDIILLFFTRSILIFLKFIFGIAFLDDDYVVERHYSNGYVSRDVESSGAGFAFAFVLAVVLYQMPAIPCFCGLCVCIYSFVMSHRANY